MKFNYDDFSYSKWMELRNDLIWKDRELLDGAYYGCVHVGNLCFDIMLHTVEDEHIDGDLYVGGLDAGYGYSEDGYPYDFAGDGADMTVEEFLDIITYKKWKALFEERAKEAINRNDDMYGTVAKAHEPLRKW